MSGISSSSSRSARHGHADETTAVARHEIDRFGRDLLGGDREVAFVLAVFVVDDDNHLARPNRLDRIVDGGKGPGRRADVFAIFNRGVMPVLVLLQTLSARGPRRSLR